TIRDFQAESGGWTFAPQDLHAGSDDFWYSAKFERRRAIEKDPAENLPSGYWIDQLSMNLHLWSVSPIKRLALTLLGIHRQQARRNARGVGTLVRGNTVRTITGNPLASQSVSDTDGDTLALHWTILNLQDDFGIDVLFPSA